jgi:hypothetical protein
VLKLIGFTISTLGGAVVHRDATKRGMSGPGCGLFTWALWIVAIPIYLAVRKPLLPVPPPALGVERG